MNVKKYFRMAAALVVGAITANIYVDSVSTNNQVDASIHFLGCKSNTTFVTSVSTSANWTKYLKDTGIPGSILTNKGRTIYIDKAKSITYCIPIYGGPSDVKDNLTGKKTQVQMKGSDGSTIWKYTGLTVKGIPFLDIRYIEEGSDYDYMKTNTFIISPWANVALNKSIAVSTVKPTTSYPDRWEAINYIDPLLGRKPTHAETLNNSVDRRYAMFCTGTCSKGIRGYLDDVNVGTKQKWTGAQLAKYISYEVVPTKYSPGLWNIYRVPTSAGVYYYNPSYTLPYLLIGQEKADLSIEIKKIEPSSVIETKTIVVTYEVCNKGQVTVTNPTVHYSDKWIYVAEDGHSKYKKVNLNATIAPGKCVNGSVSDVARTTNSDKTSTYVMIVNAEDTNPKKETNRDNNTSEKTFKLLDKIVDTSIVINSVTPTNPYSNQYSTISYTVRNNSNVEANNLVHYVGFDGQEEKLNIGYIAPWGSYTTSIKVKAPAIMAYQKDIIVRGKINATKDDLNPSNNVSEYNVRMQNPDAYVLVKGVNDGDNRLSKVNVTVYNKTFKKITNNCADSGTAGCLSGTSNKTFSYQIYDTKMTDSLADDTLVKSYTTSTYSLAHDGKQTFEIPKSVITDWVGSKYPNSYQAVQFRVVATIPNYTTEVDWDGKAQYSNNTDANYFSYIPPRNIAFNACTQIKHSNASYFKYTGTNKISINKICAGHYPTYPSTKVENGMQAYHYVLYRFLAQPIPRYEITTLSSDEKSANYFTQVTKLQDIYEAKNVRGNSESMLFTEDNVNGYNVERGRYVPTEAAFNFSIYEKKSDGSQGKQIAIGTVTHKIPSACYDKEYLDLSNQMGCNDVVFFLPNSDVGDAKYKKPSNNTNSKINYPISTTRVPYLNPGNYTFTFEGVETFRYYYQTNLSTNSYNWSNPKFK